MRVFIVKIVTFIVSYLIISICILYFAPYHWGNPWYSVKANHLEKNNDVVYNTFFFGSSRVYRQISPAIFDSTCNSISNEKVTSFNLGAPATFNPQAYYLYENFLKSELSSNAKYCFMELMDVDFLGDYFMHQERTTYWQNYSDLVFVNKSLSNNKFISFQYRMKSRSNYAISYFEKIFNIGHFGQQMIKKDFYDIRYIGEKKDGFYPLELDYQSTTDSLLKQTLRNKKNEIEKKPELLLQREVNYSTYYDHISNVYDKVNLGRINELIKKSKDKGIHLIFILSPRTGDQTLVNLSKKIAKNNLIDMANPKKYACFYKAKTAYDIGHLNTNGALLYSKLLAKEFIKRIKKVRF